MFIYPCLNFVLPHTEGFSDLQCLGHWRVSQHVHGEPVLLHGQSLVPGGLEPRSGPRSCGQPADMAAQHRGERLLRTQVERRSHR